MIGIGQNENHTKINRKSRSWSVKIFACYRTFPYLSHVFFNIKYNMINNAKYIYELLKAIFLFYIRLKKFHDFIGLFLSKDLFTV